MRRIFGIVKAVAASPIQIHCLKVGDAAQTLIVSKFITILTGALVVNKTIKILTVKGRGVSAQMVGLSYLAFYTVPLCAGETNSL
jgi:hypothetical protein